MNRLTRAAIIGLALATTAAPLAAEAQKAARRWIDAGVVTLAA